MGRAPPLVLVLAVVLGGCLPDLSVWQIVREGADAGTTPGTDGGALRPNPIDLGVPCPSPHLMVSTLTNTSGTARVMRFDPGGDTRCRASAILEEQRAFGTSIRAVHWHSETGELLGLSDAVIGLDAEGFPRWRHQDFASLSGLEGDWVAAFGSGASLRIAVAWAERSSSLDHMRLLDAQGERRGLDITPPFFGAMIAAHPDGSARLLIPSRAGDDLDVYVVNDTTTTLSDSRDATPLWPTGSVNLYDTYGYREHIASDLATSRLVITHANGIAFWRVGAPAPTTAHACPAYCGSFHAAALHPDLDDTAYAICIASGGSTRHLVRVSPSGCNLLLDGTSLGAQTLQDVTLARAPL